MMRDIIKLPDVDLLRSLLDYDPQTGVFHWRRRDVSLPYSRSFNEQFAGLRAGRLIYGYVIICVKTKEYRAHRIAWKMVHGTEPDIIDHINHDRADNRICNLRSGSRADNQKNCSRYSNNRSGYTGVSWDARSGKWKAALKSEGVTHSLGLFEDVLDAARARREAEVGFGFHPNNGLPLIQTEGK
jgi:hypothetical protein